MMLPTPRDPDDVRLTGVLLRSELLASGHNARSIAQAVRGSELVRVRRGAYVLAADWARLDAAARFSVLGRAVTRQARTSVVLSHTSATAMYDAPLWGVDLTKVHVTRSDGLSGRNAADVVQHEATLRAEDVVVLDGQLVTSPARAVLEALSCVSAEPALCLANHMLHAGYTTADDLQREYAGMAHWPHMRKAEVVLRLADPRIESVGESRVLWTVYQAGLPSPIPQHEVRDASGRLVARVDFAWPELGVFLEFDGRIKYERLLREGERASDVVLRERDRERLVCQLTGWVCIRVTWADLDRPAFLIRELRRVLLAARIA